MLVRQFWLLRYDRRLTQVQLSRSSLPSSLMNRVLIFLGESFGRKKIPRRDRRDAVLVRVFHCSCAKIQRFCRDPDVGARYFLARAGVDLEFFLLLVSKIDPKEYQVNLNTEVGIIRKIRTQKGSE